MGGEKMICRQSFAVMHGTLQLAAQCSEGPGLAAFCTADVGKRCICLCQMKAKFSPELV